MDATAWVMAAHIVTLGIWSAALLILAGFVAVAPPCIGQSAVIRHRVMCGDASVMLWLRSAVLAIITSWPLVYLRAADGSSLLAELAIVSLLGRSHAFCGKRLDAEGM